MLNIEEIRSYFPVTKNQIYLNNAAQCPLNTFVEKRLLEYTDFAKKFPDKRPVSRIEVKKLLSGLLGGSPEDYALVSSTGIGLSTVANGYPWKPGDNVVLPEYEHWNNTYPWLNLKNRGVEVRLVPMTADYRITPEMIAKYVDKNTRIVSVAAVRFNNGYRTDLAKISKIAHAHQALFVVDGIQAAGVVPLNIEKDGIDILAGGCFKWLLGMHGTGYLYVKKELLNTIKPVMPGMFAAVDLPHELNYFPDSRQYETGTIAYALYYALTAGLDLLHKIGIPAIYERVLELTNLIIHGLQENKLSLLTPFNNKEERSAIVSFTTGSIDRNKQLLEQLASENISISMRSNYLRVSPSFYNTEAEMKELIKTTHQFLKNK